MTEPTEIPRAEININIRSDLKKRYAFFIAWLRMYHEGSWTQNTAMDEILEDSRLWREFLVSEAKNI